MRVEIYMISVNGGSDVVASLDAVVTVGPPVQVLADLVRFYQGESGHCCGARWVTPEGDLLPKQSALLNELISSILDA